MIDIKIVHLADYQIEIRNSGEGNRHDEYKAGLTDALEMIRLDAPDMIINTGDLIEFYDTTAAERKVLQWFLRELSKIATVIITNGNHDLKQKNNELIMNHKYVIEPDEIETVLEAMSVANVHYLMRTGFYEIDGVTFAVWGHYEKFNKVETDQRPYSPWELKEASNYNPKNVIELFHDPVQNCKGFSGKPEMAFTDYKIRVTDFQSPLILAGDIHNPDIIKFGNEQLFTYCSSLIMRNFGEGNYYKNGNATQRGNDKHGYNVVHYKNDGTNVEAQIEFKQLKPRVTRHTIVLDGEFDYSNLEMVSIISTEFNHIRFKIDDKVNEFFENQDKIYAYLQSVCTCVFAEPVFDKDVGIDFDDEYTIESVESLIDSDKVVEMSNIYIDKAVDKTKTIGKEDKENAKTMLKGIFKKAFDSAGDLTTNIKQVNVEQLKISNALTFSDNVVVNIDDVGSIVRVTGANAVGKTKIFTVLGYMFTDLLHGDQKPTQHKNNRLELFNYTRPTDVVEVEMHFKVNGKPHSLKKTVTRTWKKSVNMWQNKDWKDYVVGTPTLDIELKTGDGTVITDYETVMLYMRDLISFDDFYRHIFVNQRSLENLLKMKSENLITEILQIIGLNFFDTLLEKYDEEKDRIMENLSKPSGTIESLLAEIGKNKSIIENCNNRDKEIDLDLKANKENKDILQESIDELKQSVGSVRKVEAVNLDVESKNDVKDVKKERLETLKTLVSAGQNIVDSINLDELAKTVVINETAKELLIEKNASINSDIENIEKDAINKQKEIDTYIQEKKNEKETCKNVINAVINTETTNINKHNERLIEIKGVIATNLKSKQDANAIKIKDAQESYELKRGTYATQDKVVSVLDDELSTLNTKVSNIKLTIETLKVSDKCSSCGEYVSETVLPKIKAQELLLEEGIISTNKKFNEHKESKDRLDVLKVYMDESYEILTNAKAVVISHSIADEPELKTEVQGIAKGIGASKDIIALKKTELINIDNDESYLTSTYVTERNAQIANVSTKKIELNEIVETNKTKIASHKELIDGVSTKKKERSDKELEVVTNKGHIKGCEKDIEIVDKEISILEKELGLAKGMVNVFETIETKEKVMTSYLETDKTLEEEKTHNKYTVESSLKFIEESNKDIESLKKYTLTTAVVKQYKTMLGKNGLQKYIFGKIVDILNSKLSILLENVSMRLFFDKDTLDLRKYDLRKNILSGVQMASGMESSILGLSLLKALKSLNQIRKFNVLMVDEISGQFNDGMGLTYKAYNYQELFTILLGKVKDDTCIFVVDHVIKDLGESSTLEVELTDSGSVIKLK